MKTERCMTQTELAERWQISEATLERWRTESAGPLFLKLGNQVRYRLEDVEAFEEAALRGSTKTDDDADKTAKMHRTASRRMQASTPVLTPDRHLATHRAPQYSLADSTPPASIAIEQGLVVVQCKSSQIVRDQTLQGHAEMMRGNVIKHAPIGHPNDLYALRDEVNVQGSLVHKISDLPIPREHTTVNGSTTRAAGNLQAAGAFCHHLSDRVLIDVTCVHQIRQKRIRFPRLPSLAQVLLADSSLMILKLVPAPVQVVEVVKPCFFVTVEIISRLHVGNRFGGPSKFSDHSGHQRGIRHKLSAQTRGTMWNCSF